MEEPSFFERLLTGDQRPARASKSLLDTAFDSDDISITLRSPALALPSRAISLALVSLDEARKSLSAARQSQQQQQHEAMDLTSLHALSSTPATTSNDEWGFSAAPIVAVASSTDTTTVPTPDPFAEMFSSVASPKPSKSTLHAEVSEPQQDADDDAQRLKLLLRLRASVVDASHLERSPTHGSASAVNRADLEIQRASQDASVALSDVEAIQTIYRAESSAEAAVWLPTEPLTGRAFAPQRLMCEHWLAPLIQSSSEVEAETSLPSNAPFESSKTARLLLVAGGGRFVLSAGYADASIKAHSVANAQVRLRIFFFECLSFVF